MIALRFLCSLECPVVAGNVLPCLVTLQSSREPTSRRSVCSCQVRTPFAAWARLLQSGVHRLFCGRPARAKLCSCQARTPFAARRASLREGAHLLVWEARLGTKLLLLPGCTPFAARARLLRAGMHICLCGRPALGAKLLLLPGPHTIRRVGAPPTQRCARPVLWEARLGAKLLLLKTSRSAQAGTHVGWALAHHTRRYA